MIILIVAIAFSAIVGWEIGGWIIGTEDQYDDQISGDSEADRGNSGN